jgi:methionyl-tRNA formyltransferase
MMTKYSKLYPTLPSVPIVYVDNINDFDTLQAVEIYSPDMVMVSGTNLVGKKIIEACEANKVLILNLHTGLSPYIKGGPNCTNWCLATGNLHLIGNTVMKLDSGIDSGPIIATEQTELTGKESLTELHWKVMEHGFGLYCDIVDKISKFNNDTVQAIQQDEIGQGVTYFNRDWNTWQVVKAEWNFLVRFNVKNLTDERYAKESSKLNLIGYLNNSKECK